MKKKHLLWLILLIGLVLRIYQLGHLEVFGDELDVGYHAYSLWKTGRDYTGSLLPVYIRSFAEWRAPLLMYVTAPVVGIFGLNAWTVRMPSVFFGLITIFLIYKLTIKLTKSEKFGLVAALILTITPWHIHYSRTAFEVSLLLALVLSATLAYLNKRFLVSAILFSLSFYTYNTANIFVPLFGLVLIWLEKENLKTNPKLLIFPGLAIAVILLPLFNQVISGQASARFNLISIFNDQEVIHEIVHLRNTGLSPSVERIFHNKLTGWGSAFVNNYLTAFSPQFLFLLGDPNPRHSLPGWGQFYWLLLPFLILGILYFPKVQNSRFKILVTSWLLIAPIPAALTVGGGDQATRLFLMLPPLIILTALGIYKLKNKILLFTVYLLLFTFLIFFFHNYFVHYPKETYQNWHYGYQEAMTWLNANPTKGRIIINNSREPALIRYLFWNKVHPSAVHFFLDRDIIEPDILDGFDGFQFENLYFGQINQSDKIEWLKANLEKDDLYLGFQGGEVPGDWDWSIDPPEEIKTLKVVNDPWGKPLIYWLTSANGQKAE